ncbi:hypothetical protein ACP70R_009622 [Stipagrostis hirtigluma subsp. patula]
MDDKKNVKKEIDISVGPPPRKGGLKFAPKVPTKKAAKVVPKKEPVEESKDDIVDKELLMKLKTSQITDPFARRVKTEDKRVAFGQGNSSHARSFPMPKSSTASKPLKEYAEPWDYEHTDYPVTLPLRRPYSGDPGILLVFLAVVAWDFLQQTLTSYIPNAEILDEEEFGESSASRAQDAELTAAEELGLMDLSDRPQLLFFQLPSSLPLPMKPQSVVETNSDSKQNSEPASTSAKEKPEMMRPSSLHGSKLRDLPGGFMGKILVYRSGKVKMKIGEALFDVSAGSNCMFAQEVAAINTREKHCCTMGEVSKRAVVTPDIDYMLGSGDRMEE